MDLLIKEEEVVAVKDPSHEDLRQRRTKKFLVQALLELMEERPFRDLSVVDICDRAMVHRTTFYVHFEDKTALLRYAVLQLQREFEATVEERKGDDRGYFLAMFRNALTFVRAHRKLYLSGLAGGGHELRMLEDVVAGELLERGCGRPCVAGGDASGAEAAAHFFAGAVLSTIRWWLEGDMPVDEETLIGYVEHFIPQIGAEGK